MILGYKHEKWSPHCFYLVSAKGKSFVDKVLNNSSSPPNKHQTVNNLSVKGNNHELCKVYCSCELVLVFLPCAHSATGVNCAITLTQCVICGKDTNTISAACRIVRH